MEPRGDDSSRLTLLVVLASILIHKPWMCQPLGLS